jgi:hypothetical protein
MACSWEVVSKCLSNGFEAGADLPLDGCVVYYRGDGHNGPRHRNVFAEIHHTQRRATTVPTAGRASNLHATVACVDQATHAEGFAKCRLSMVSVSGAELRDSTWNFSQVPGILGTSHGDGVLEPEGVCVTS